MSTHVLHMKAAESFLETSQCTNFTEKSGSGDYWQRPGLKNPDKPKIFIKKNGRNHSYHQFYSVLAKIQINRGLLYQTQKTQEHKNKCRQSKTQDIQKIN